MDLNFNLLLCDLLLLFSFSVYGFINLTLPVVELQEGLKLVPKNRMIEKQAFFSIFIIVQHLRKYCTRIDQLVSLHSLPLFMTRSCEVFCSNTAIVNHCTYWQFHFSWLNSFIESLNVLLIRVYKRFIWSPFWKSLFQFVCERPHWRFIRFE